MTYGVRGEFLLVLVSYRFREAKQNVRDRRSNRRTSGFLFFFVGEAAMYECEQDKNIHVMLSSKKNRRRVRR